MRPLEEFLRKALRDFEQQLRREAMPEADREQRKRGARDFAVFVLGRPISPDGAGDGGRVRRR